MYGKIAMLVPLSYCHVLGSPYAALLRGWDVHGMAYAGASLLSYASGCE